jgi:hypothetical protein
MAKMKFTRACMLLLVCLFANDAVAKGLLTRIEVESGSLRAPVEIQDTQALTLFNPWSGRGAWSEGVEQATGFIVDWVSQAPSPAANTGSVFKVRFYARHNSGSEKVAYTVLYTYVASDEAQEAVYLPGKGDAEYSDNVASIFRGVEGKWFRPTAEWQHIVRPLIRQALAP